MKWFYVEEGAQQGPVSESELRSMRRNGQLSFDSLVWSEGMEKWEYYSEAIGDNLDLLPTPPVVPSDVLLENQVVEATVYAGFWIRGAAKIIDVIILSFLHLVMILLMGTESTVDPMDASEGNFLVLALGMVLSVGYFTFFHGRTGQTPGKKFLRIEVVSPDGGRIGYQKALGRALVEILSRVILCIGYIMAAFDSEKKSLHDIVCKTRVIYKK
ncbi:MAG: RDD family protein [Opitutaceae bacterium]|nr:RDD family protein [Opitutaceae bacterium]